MSSPVYLDNAATTAVDDRVATEVLRYMTDEFGNAGSRSHDYGQRAKAAAETARRQLAELVGASREEVVFTSGATESNNLALLGFSEFGLAEGRTHIISTAIEHKAVLEPLGVMARRGFEVDLLPVGESGWVDPEDLTAALRPTTLLVSVMHVNNETGVCQPIDDLATALADHPAFLHVDAAQGFGKLVPSLRNPRIDLVSASGHKIFAPKGVGALVCRRRQRVRPPIAPLQFGGGQERGIRPGTLPVPLVVGLGIASRIAQDEHDERREACLRFRKALLEAIAPLEPMINGDESRSVSHIVNMSFDGLDSEAVMLALKDVAAFSNGSACTSQSYEPSHVLAAMGLSEGRAKGAVRLSWSHTTPEPDWDRFVSRLTMIL